MTAKLVELRSALFDQIDTNRIGGDYEFADFELEQTYFPNEDLTNLSAKPHVKIIGLTNDRSRIQRSATNVTLDLPIQVAIQQKVTASDTAYIDRLIVFLEQLQDTCQDDTLVTGKRYNWLRTEALKDESEAPYNYEQLRIQGVFNAIFTAFYKHIKDA